MVLLNYIPKKVIFSVLLFTFSLIGIIIVNTKNVYASEVVEEGEWRDNVTWTYDSEGTLTINGKGKMDVPKKDEEYPWCGYRSWIKKIVIGRGITNISAGAFYSKPDSEHQYSRLTEVQLSDTVFSIGKNAFRGCKQLKNIVMPDELKSIGNDAFRNCKNLTDVLIPSQLENLGKRAFLGCSSLESIAVPNGIKVLQEGVFYGCKKLTNVILPKSLKVISNSVFRKCISLKKIVLPSKIMEMGKRIFLGCNNLKSITIKSKIMAYIGDDTFKDISELAAIKVPKGRIYYYEELLNEESGFKDTMTLK